MVAEFVSKEEKIPIDKFTVIYNGVEVDKINEAQNNFKSEFEQIKNEIGVPAANRVILTVARLVVQKNHKLMVDAFAKLLEKNKNVTLVIIGDGPLRPALEEQSTRLGIRDNIIFTGERQDIYRFYSIADYFLLTSIREGFCISAMNGLAFGLPLISTRVAGVIEYLEDGKNGFFTENSPEDIAATLEKTLNLSKQELAEMKKNASQTALSFSTQIHAHRYRELFSKCLIK
jgi:glycosyltransferase involved in cell wall biosynthesis